MIYLINEPHPYDAAVERPDMSRYLIAPTTDNRTYSVQTFGTVGSIGTFGSACGTAGTFGCVGTAGTSGNCGTNSPRPD
jgi:hypothetical protein